MAFLDATVSRPYGYALFRRGDSSIHAIGGHAVRLAAPDPRIRQHSDRIEAFGAPVAGSLATIVRSFKAATTRAIRERIGQPIVV